MGLMGLTLRRALGAAFVSWSAAIGGAERTS